MRIRALVVPLLALACASPAPVAPPRDRDTRFTAAADGVPIAYSVTGSGPTTVVFLHGWSADRSYWDAQADAFAGTRRVVTIDLGGHGESGRQRERWSLDRLAGDVVAVLAAEDLQDVVLVGHSMGAPVALLTARRCPDRVIGIVAVEALHDAERKTDPDETRAFLAAWAEDFRATCDGFVRAMFPPDADPELVDRVAGDLCAAPPDVALPLMLSFPEFDLQTALERTPVPIRAINSAAYPTRVDANRRYAADFDAVHLAGVGHFLMLERPTEFNVLLEHELQEIEALRDGTRPAPP